MPLPEIVDKLLFPTPAATYDADDFPGELIWIPRGLDPQDANPEDCVPCLLLTSPSARFFVLYLHSNAEDLGRCRSFCTVLRAQFQVHVLAVEYPGYGICPGKQASEDTVVENAFLAFSFLREVLHWPLDEIIVLGRSIGCGPALAIAARHQVCGLVLICPFLSFRALVREFIGRLSEFIKERFPNDELMKLVSSPLLIVHGKGDSVVPWSHGSALYEACSTRKRLVTPEHMQHNTNLLMDPSFFVLPMLQFFALPDYSFDELEVPLWAFNRRLSPTREPSEQASPGSSCLLQTTTVFRGIDAASPCKPPAGGDDDGDPAESEEEDDEESGCRGKAWSASPDKGAPTTPAAARTMASARYQGSPPSERPATPQAPAEVPAADSAVDPSAPQAPAELPGQAREAEEAEGFVQAEEGEGPDEAEAEGEAEGEHARDRKAEERAEEDESAVLDKAAEAALMRFLDMQCRGEGDVKIHFDAEITEEVLDPWPMEWTQDLEAEAVALEDELMTAPDDQGYLKVPRSRACGPGSMHQEPSAPATRLTDCGGYFSCGSARAAIDGACSCGDGLVAARSAGAASPLAVL